MELSCSFLDSECPELEKYKLKSDLIPDTVYYVPDFIDQSEEERLITNVQQAPKPKWTYLQNRSLQNWGGLPHPKGMIPEPLPNWLKIYTEKLGKLNLFEGKEPNHILMNRYLAGQGIMAHEDGPLFYPTVTTINAGSHTVLNFYRKPEQPDQDREYVFSLLLWPRSLLVLRHQAYTSYLHEIEELTCDTIIKILGTVEAVVAQESSKNNKYIFANLDHIPSEALKSDGDHVTLDRDIRYSFTIRYVPNVLKNLNIQKLLFKK